MNRSLYDLLVHVYSLEKKAANTTDTPELKDVTIPRRLLESLIGLMIGGYLGQSAVTESDDPTARFLKSIGGAGLGAIGGYYRPDLFAYLQETLAKVLTSDKDKDQKAQKSPQVPQEAAGG